MLYIGFLSTNLIWDISSEMRGFFSSSSSSSSSTNFCAQTWPVGQLLQVLLPPQYAHVCAHVGNMPSQPPYVHS